MLPFKKILAPVDFSDHANRALQCAVEMADHFGARLYVIHVIAPVPLLDLVDMGEFGMGGPVGPMSGGIDVAAYQEQLVASNRNALQKLVAHLVPQNLDYEILIEVGEAAAVINEAAHRQQIDVIVMATHGLTGLSHLLLGSVTEKVARSATVPVLIVRQQENKK